MKKTMILLASLAMLTGCGPVVKYPTPLIGPDVRPVQQTAKEYSIQPGDQLDVRFYNNPELNEQVTVRPDGRISLQLAPEVIAAEKTPAELSRSLVQAYSSELREPKVTVIVRTFGSNKVYVGGEVGKPGMLNLTGALTVMQSITEAGGFLDTARKGEVVVIRKGEKKPLIFTVNIEDVISGSDLTQDMNLRPYDIVFVPKLPIANIDLWVDQYIRRLIPIPFGFGFNYD